MVLLLIKTSQHNQNRVEVLPPCGHSVVLQQALQSLMKPDLQNSEQNQPAELVTSSRPDQNLWTHLLCSAGTDVAFLKLSLTMERRHVSFSDRDRNGGPGPAPRAVSEDDSGRVSGAKLSSRICLALSQI